MSRLPPLAWAAALIQLALHLATATVWPLFRDELYYLACADHLAWGYVDHPPLSIAVLWAVRAILGDGALAIRLVPALAGAALVLISARLALDLGGGRFAAGLGAASVAVAPLFLAVTGYYSMNALDLVVWAGLAWLVVRAIATDDPRWWLAFGALAGLGLENKASVLFIGAGAAAALVVTPLRAHLRTPWPWAGAGLAAALVAPHLAWQVGAGWPTAEFVRNAQLYKNAPISPAGILAANALDLNPILAPLWLAGLGWLAVGRYRALAVIAAVAFLIVATQHGKPYYLGPAYPMLFAAGACAVERWVERRAWRFGLLGVAVAAGAVTAPFAVPALPVESFLAYQAALGQTPRSDEDHELGPLPQFYADRFGWEELARAVAEVVRALPPGERVLVVCGNYGEAGAVDHYGRALGLPPAASPHNSYWTWGPAIPDPDVVVAVGMGRDDLERLFDSVTPAATLSSPYAMPYETANPIYVCRGPKIPLSEAWAQARRFI